MTSLNKRIAITGGTGFIGRAVLQILSSRDVQTKALTRRAAADLEQVNWVSGDLQNDAALRELVRNCDVVIHLAGLTKAPTKQALFDANAEAAGRFARLAAESGVSRFIFVSSLAAREPHLSNYAGSKRAGEDAVLAATGEMEVVIVRPPAIIGPGDDATAQMLNAMKSGWLPIPGGANRKQTLLSFMYVEDIARFIVDQIDVSATETPLEPAAEAGGIGWGTLAATASEILSKRVRLLPVPPFILFPAAYCTEVTSALFNRSTFFNTGKVREMLHTDWTGRIVMNEARAFKESLALAFGQDTPR